MLKLLQMFTSVFNSLIVFIASSLLEQICKEQYIIKGHNSSDKMVVCENAINLDFSNPFFQS